MSDKAASTEFSVVGMPSASPRAIQRTLLLQKAETTSERMSWSPIKLSSMGGECRIDMEFGATILRENQTMHIPAHVEHQITALTDVEVLIEFQPYECEG